PRLTRETGWWVEAHRDLDVIELDSVGPGELDRLRDAVLLHQAADDRPAISIDACLHARVITDGNEARLDRTDCAVGELADEDVAVVDIHAHHAARRPHHAFGYEISQ